MNRVIDNIAAFVVAFIIGIVLFFFVARGMMSTAVKTERDRNEEINTHVLAAWENGDPGEHECPCPEFCTKHYYEWLKMKARAK